MENTFTLNQTSSLRKNKSPFLFKLSILTILVLGSAINKMNAQYSGAVTIPNGTFTTVQMYLDSLNQYGLNGALTVTFTGTQTSPVLGYQLGSSTLNASLSSTNTLTFTGGILQGYTGGTRIGTTFTSGTSTARPLNDAIFVVKGCDFVTFNAVTFNENSANTTPATMMENAIAFHNLNSAFPMDGCRNVNVTNCTFNMPNPTGTNVLHNQYQVFATNSQYSLTTTTPVHLNWEAPLDQDRHRDITITGNTFNDGSNHVLILGAYHTANFRSDSFSTIRNVKVNNNIHRRIACGGTIQYGVGIFATDTIEVQNNIFDIDSSHNSTAYGVTIVNCGGRSLVYNNEITAKRNLTSNQIVGINHLLTCIGNGRPANPTAITRKNRLFMGFHNTTTFTPTSTPITYLAVVGSQHFHSLPGLNRPSFSLSDSNSIINQTYAGNSTVILILGNGYAGQTSTYKDNIFKDITRTGTGGTTYGIFQNTNYRNIFSGNLIENIKYDYTGTTTGTGYFVGIMNQHTQTTVAGASGIAEKNIIRNINMKLATTTNTSLTSTINTIKGIEGLGFNDTIRNNIIHNLSATMTANGTSNVYGITFPSQSLTYPPAYVYNNLIDSLRATSSAAQASVGTGNNVKGIYFNSTGTVYAVNNYIGELYSPQANNLNPVTGIYSGSTGALHAINNTISIGRLGALTSTGSNFGGEGIFYGAGGSGAGNTILKNNIISVKGIPPVSGGSFVAIRRSSGVTGTKPANFTANNNTYFVNTNNNNYIYGEGTTASSLANGYYVAGTSVAAGSIFDAAFNTSCGLYKIFMAGENSTFVEDSLNTAGPLANTTTSGGTNTYSENSGEVVSSIYPYSPDLNNVSRNAVFPDRGALEFSAIVKDATGPSISYTPVPTMYCTTAPTISAVINDPSGVNTTAGTRPRLYYKKTTDNDAFGANTSAFNGWKYVESASTGSPFTFTFNYAIVNGGSVAVNDTIQYYVVAQDNVSTPNVGMNAVTLTPSGVCPSSVDIGSTAGLVSTIVNTRFLVSGSPTFSVLQTPTTSCVGDTIKHLVIFPSPTASFPNYTAVVTGMPGINSFFDTDTVQINSFVNSSLCTSGGSAAAINTLPASITGRYSNYTATSSLSLVSGSVATYKIAISVTGTASTYNYAHAIYIDYNRNGAFELPFEAAVVSPMTPATNTVNTCVNIPNYVGSFNIPTNISSGPTLMRVMTSALPTGPFTGPSMTGFNYGETEDYQVELIGAPDPAISTFSWTSNKTGSTILSTTNPLTHPTISDTTIYTNAISISGCTFTILDTTYSGAQPKMLQTNNRTMCGANVPPSNFNVVDSNAFTTPTINWFLAPTGGIPVQSSTSTVFTSSVSVTTTYYVTVQNPATGCWSPRKAMTLTVNPSDSIVGKGNTIRDSIKVCFGQTINLTTTNVSTPITKSFDTFTWNCIDPASGIATPLVNTTGTQSITPTLAGSYLLIVSALDTGGMCGALDSLKLVVQPNPFAGGLFYLNTSPFPSCQGDTVTHNVYGSSTSAPPTGYGVSSATTTADEEIHEVSVGTLTSNSGCTGITSPAGGPHNLPASVISMYSNYTTTATATPIPDIISGSVMPWSLKLGYTTGNGTAWSYGYSIYIDYNRNGAFEVPAERVATSTALLTSPTGCNFNTYTGNFTVPTNITAGPTLMRVIINEGSVNPAPTGTFGFGETEDYTVNLIGKVDTNSTKLKWTSTGTGSTTIGTNNPLKHLTTIPNQIYTVVMTNSACVDSLKDTVGSPLPKTLGINNRTMCGADIPPSNFNVVDSNTFTTPIINWFSAATGGTLLQSSTSTVFNSIVSTTTTYYVTIQNPTSGCWSPRVPMTLTVLPTDSIVGRGNTIRDSIKICMGLPINLTVTNVSVPITKSFDTFTWNCDNAGSGIAAPMVNTTGTQTITPTLAGTYFLVVRSIDTGTSCKSIDTLKLVVQSNPFAGGATYLNTSPFPSCHGDVVTHNIFISSPSGTFPTYTALGSNGIPTNNGFFDIDSLQINSFVSSSACSGSGPAGGGSTTAVNSLPASITGIYSNFTTSSSFDLTGGTTATWRIVSNFIGLASQTYDHNYAIYIDYNRNGTFELPAETVTMNPTALPRTSPAVTTCVNVAPFFGSFTVPNTIVSGPTLMRVMLNNLGTPFTGPTMNNTYGETEDYQINLIGKVDTFSTKLSWTSNATGATELSRNNPLVHTTTIANQIYKVVMRNSACVDSLTDTVGSPLPKMLQTVDRTMCGAGIPPSNFNVVDSNTFTTPTINWFNVATGGTPLQSSTSTVYNNIVTMTSTFYVAVQNPATGCWSPRKAMTLTLIPSDSIVGKGNTIRDSMKICLGLPINLTAANVSTPITRSFDTFTWNSVDPGSGIVSPMSNTTGTQTITPTLAGTYFLVVKALDTGSTCTALDSLKLVVQNNPFAGGAFYLNTTPNPACIGAAVTHNVYGSSTSAPPTGYGASNATTTADEEIHEVVVGTLTSNSGCAGITSPAGGPFTLPASVISMYSNYTTTTPATPVPDIVSGTVVPWSLKLGYTTGNTFAWTYGYSIFIDYNRNGTFEVPAERVATSTALVSAPSGCNFATVSGNFTVPATITAGTTLMRIVHSESIVNPTPTGTFGFGETEDYVVNLIGKVDTFSTKMKWRSNATGATILGSNNPLIHTTTVSPQIYTVTMTNSACVDSLKDTVTNNVPPLNINPLVGATTACFQEAIKLKAPTVGGCTPYSYAWSQAGGGSFTAPVNLDSIIFTPSGTTGVRTITVIVTDNAGTKDTMTHTISFNNPTPTAIIDDTVCSSGSGILSATPSVTGDVIKWFATATDLNELMTGNTFTTPVVTATTKYYARQFTSVSDSCDPLITSSNGIGSGFFYGERFVVTKKLILKSVDLYPFITGASTGSPINGNCNVMITTDNAANTPLFTTPLITFPVSTASAAAASAAAPTKVPLGFELNPGSYKIYFSQHSANAQFVYAGTTFPKTTTSGAFSITTGIDNGGGTYNFNLHFWNFQVEEGCWGAPITDSVLVTAPPAFAIDRKKDSICSGSILPIVTVTTPCANYTPGTFTWNNAANWSGSCAAGFLNNQTTPGTYQHIITAEQTNAPFCKKSDTFTLTVKSIPTPIVKTPSVASLNICKGGIEMLKAVSGPTFPITWSPTTSLFTNAAASASYTGTNRDSVWAAPANTIKYYMTATHANSCTIKDSITLNVTDTATITVQPIPFQSLCVGDTLKLIASATSTSALTRQWKKNGTAIGSPSAVTDTLVLVTTSPADSGDYTIEYSTGGPCGVKVSSIALIKVRAAIVITSQPKDTTICIGTPFSILSIASNDSAVFWTHVGGSLSATGTNDLYSVSAAAYADSGRYFLTFQSYNPCPNKVSDTIKVRVLPPAAITTQPAALTTIPQGDSVTLKIVATGALGYQWYKNGVIMAGETKDSLKVIGTSVATDTFTCTVASPSGCSNATSSSSNGIIVVNPLIVIPMQPAPKTFTCENSQTLIAVTAVNATGYQWYKDNVMLTGETNDTLIINPTLLSHAGIYKCQIMGMTSVPSVFTTNDTLVVTELAKLAAPLPTGFTVCQDQPILMTAFGSSATVDFQWLHNGNAVGSPNDTFSSASATLAQAGTYRVIALSGMAGTTQCLSDTSTPFTGIVHPKIVITVQPDSKTMTCENSPSVFTVTATNALSYQWKKNGTNVTIGTGGTTNNYQITPTTATGDAGIYTVEITGTSPCPNVTSNNDTLVVTQLALVTTPLVGFTVCQDQPFMMNTTGNAATTGYQWLHNGTNVGPNNDTFGVTMATVAMAGQYRVVALSGMAGATQCKSDTSAAVTGIVHPKVIITSQPASKTMTCENSPSVFTVTASNALSYQWKKNGTNVTVGTGGTTNNYQLTPATTPGDAGIYTVEITGTSPCPNVTSINDTLVVTTLAKITTPPSAFDVCEGQTFTLNGVATNAASFQWLLNGSNKSTAMPYSVNPAILADSGMYRLVALSANAGATVCKADTSAAVLGAVRGSVKITNAPVNTIGCVGAALSLTSLADNASGYAWVKNGVTMTNGGNISGTNANILNFTPFAAKDTGSYEVVISGNGACASVTTTAVQVTSTTAAVITSEPKANPSFCMGGTLNLSVAAQAAVTYEWYHNGNIISGQTTNQLSIPSVTSANAGTYHVIAIAFSGCIPDTSINSVVTIANPIVITTQPTPSQTLCEGNTVNLSVSNTGTAPYTYAWKRPSSAVGVNSNSYMKPNVGVVADAGNYTVDITGDTSCPTVTSNPAVVNINYKPVIAIQPNGASPVCIGSPINICATSSNVSSVEWHKTGSGQVGSGTCFTKVAVSNDGGTYFAIAKALPSCVDLGSSNFTLAISTPVTVLAQPQSKEMLEDPAESHRLQAVVTGSGPFTYQWKKNGTSISGAVGNFYDITNYVASRDTGNYTCEIRSGAPCNSIVSTSIAKISSVKCPNITEEPTVLTPSVTICKGMPFSLNVTATSARTYQWYKDNEAIPGAIYGNYSVSNLSSSPANTGTYKVRVFAYDDPNCPVLYSQTVNVVVKTIPKFIIQPQQTRECQAGSHTMIVDAEFGDTYQWFMNNVPAPGVSTNKSYTYNNVNTIGDDFYVIADNAVCDNSKSNTVRLELTNPATQVTLATKDMFNLTRKCTDASGWTYYANPTKSKELMLAIKHNDATMTASPDIEIRPSIREISPLNIDNRGAVMGSRIFNLDLGKTVTQPYEVKFFIDAAEETAVLTRFNDIKTTEGSRFLSAHDGTELSFIVTTQRAFNSIVWANLDIPLAIENSISTTDKYMGSENGVRFAAIQGLTSTNSGGVAFMDYKLKAASSVINLNANGFGMNLYPVPSSDGKVTVDIQSNELKTLTFTVTDMTGRIIGKFEEKHNSLQSSHKFDFSSLANGNYQMTISNTVESTTARFTINK